MGATEYQQRTCRFACFAGLRETNHSRKGAKLAKEEEA
jgi:hypothetical protein